VFTKPSWYTIIHDSDSTNIQSCKRGKTNGIPIKVEGCIDILHEAIAIEILASVRTGAGVLPVAKEPDIATETKVQTSERTNAGGRTWCNLS
jgi:hypothetical protein